jgi:hypothetical protein
MLELTNPVRDSANHFGNVGGPANKGRRYPADPPRVEEIVAVMRQAGTDRYEQRLRGAHHRAVASGSSDLLGARPH